MNGHKRKKLESKGWKIGTVQEFLNLSTEETKIMTRISNFKDFQKINEAKKEKPSMGVDILQNELISELETIPDNHNYDEDLIDKLEKEYPKHAEKIKAIANDMGKLGNDYNELAGMHDEDEDYDRTVKEIEKSYKSIEKKIRGLK